MKLKLDLIQLAYQAMKEKGLQPEFSEEALQQTQQITHPAALLGDYLDLRSLLWCSIDNEDSRDLDQLTYAEKTNGKTVLWIAIADVDALIHKNSPIDKDARFNTTSVYTPAKIFPMLPKQFSTNLTSLNEHADRAALVVKIQISPIGDIETSSIFQAIVHNQAQLTYRAIGDWLEGADLLPEKVKKVPGLEKALKLQHEVAQILRQRRHQLGTLTLEPAKAEIKIDDDAINIELNVHNFAHQLIEEFMIAANRSIAHHLSQLKIPSLRRVVRYPKYWDRIVEIAESYGQSLSKQPSPKSLDSFLIQRQKVDPEGFADLSLTIIKLLGRGEYVVQDPKKTAMGHFALGISEYTHATAPNRRYSDLIAQRQYKAILRHEENPYSLEELNRLAAHCTLQEDAATKVERKMNKSAAAIMLSSQIGKVFEGMISGASEKGTWVRLLQPPIEGKIIQGFENLKVGDKVSVQLTHVDVQKGFIDFAALRK